MKQACAYSGENLANLKERDYRPYYSERGRMIVCPGCKRHLKATRAGFAAAWGSIPQHKDPGRRA